MNQPVFHGSWNGLGFLFPLLPLNCLVRGFGFVDARPAQELPVPSPSLKSFPIALSFVMSYLGTS